MPGLPIAGPEKDERRPPLSGRRLSSVCVSCHQTLRQTLTPDNGSELSGFRELERADLCAYFCRPHLFGQRSANENEGGLLRQGFPRGISLHKITEKMLGRAQYD